MTLNFDVGIIGAGCIGAGIAAALSDTHLRVALIDQGRLGSSAYSAGVVRLYDPDPQLMALAAYSISLIGYGSCGRAFDAALRRTGMIYRAPLDEADTLADTLARQATEQHPTQFITDRQVSELSPLACTAAGRVNLYEPQSGLSDVRQSVRHMITAARQRATVIEQTAIQSIHAVDPVHVLLDMGEAQLACRIIIVATGGWTNQLLSTPHIQARSIPLVRLMAPRPTPMPLIDVSVGSYAIPLSDQIVQVGSKLRDAAAIPDELPSTRAEQAADAAARLAKMSGCQNVASSINVLPGFDAYSPDGHPLVGFIDPTSPVYLATGMCGLGYKFTPAIAQIACQDVLRRLDGDETGLNEQWAWLSPTRLGQRAPAQMGVHP